MPKACARLWFCVGVDLGQHDLALALCGGLLEQRRQAAAGAAPGRPEVHDDRCLRRALDHLRFEVGLVDVENCHDAIIPGRSRVPPSGALDISL